jgi:hypothetical protein
MSFAQAAAIAAGYVILPLLPECGEGGEISTDERQMATKCCDTIPRCGTISVDESTNPEFIEESEDDQNHSRYGVA